MIPMTPLPNEPPTILIVDDYPANLRVLLDSLKTSGWKVIVATNGESALRQANFAAPDAILLDVMMPDMDGHQVLTSLRNEPSTAHIPFIFMTARAAEDDIRQGIELGADHYIIKPFRHKLLLEAIEAMVVK